MFARSPGYFFGEGHPEIVQHPTNDEVVVDTYDAGDDDHGPAEALEQWAHPPYFCGTQAGELADGELQEEQGDSTDEEEDEVGNQEGTWGKMT